MDMVGDGVELFAPTNDLGIYYTTDEGNNWQSMAGSPNQPLEPSRAYLTSTKIWSFQSAGLGGAAKDLMSCNRPTTNINIHIVGAGSSSPVYTAPPPDYRIVFQNVACGVAIDTAITLFGCNCGPTVA